MIWRLSWRYIFSARRDAFLVVVVRMAVVGIALGVAALVVVLSVMRGFHKELLKSMMQMESHVSVLGPRGQQFWEAPRALVQALRQHQDVERVVPLMATQGAFMHERSIRGVNVRGVFQEDMSQEPMVWHLRRKDFHGDDLPMGDAIVGFALARDMGVRIGDTLELVLPQAYTTLLGMMPVVVPVRVAGVTETKYYIADANTVLVSAAFCARMMHACPEHVQRLDVYARDPEQLEGIVSLLRQQNIAPERIHLWWSRHAAFIQTLQVERLVMTIILTLMILVAGFNVVSGLMMFVRDKRYDTALLRLMGYPKEKVSALYMLSGLIMAMGGVLIGLVVGVLVCVYIEPIRRGIEYIFNVDLFKEEFYMLGQVPADCSVDLVISIAGVSLLVSVLSVWFPARKAAKQSPLECLRYET